MNVRVLRSGKVIPTIPQYLPKLVVIKLLFTAETRFIQKVKLELDLKKLTRNQKKLL